MLTAQENSEYRDFLHFAFSEHGMSIASRLCRIFTRPQLTRLARDHGFALSARIVDLSFSQWLALFRYYASVAAGERRRLVAGSERRLLRSHVRLTKIHRSRTAPEWNRVS